MTGWHRASDALGSVLLVLAVACSVLAVLGVRGWMAPEPMGRVHRRVHGLLAAAGLGLLGAAVIIGPLPLVFPLLGSPAGASAAFAHLALGLATAGLTVLAIGGFGRLLEPFAPGRRQPPPQRAGGAPPAV